MLLLFTDRKRNQAAFPVVWQQIRGRSPEYASLTYLSILGGFTLGALIIGCFLQDWQFKRAYDEHRYVPETRIGPATWAGFAVPLGLFLFAWTAPYDGELCLILDMESPQLIAFFSFGSPRWSCRRPLHYPLLCPHHFRIWHAGRFQFLAVVRCRQLRCIERLGYGRLHLFKVAPWSCFPFIHERCH